MKFDPDVYKQDEKTREKFSKNRKYLHGINFKCSSEAL